MLGERKPLPERVEGSVGAPCVFAEVPEEVALDRGRVAAEPEQARPQVLSRIVSAPKRKIRSESPQLRVPGVGEELLLQLGPARDANLLHGHAFALRERATLIAWRRRRPSPRASSSRSSPDCPASAPSTKSRSRRARRTSRAARSSARRSWSPSISPFG